jgi:hypothetical protein
MLPQKFSAATTRIGCDPAPAATLPDELDEQPASDTVSPTAAATASVATMARDRDGTGSSSPRSTVAIMRMNLDSIVK